MLLDKLKSTLDIGLPPKLSLSAEWSRAGASSDGQHTNWPPPPEVSIYHTRTLEEDLWAKQEIGDETSLLDGARHTAFKLAGLLQLDADSSRRGFRDFEDATLRLAGSRVKCELTLTASNITGVRQVDDVWPPWESGARWMLRQACGEGYPAAGLFTYEGMSSSGRPQLRAVYFVSVAAVRGLKSHILTRGFDAPALEGLLRQKISRTPRQELLPPPES